MTRKKYQNTLQDFLQYTDYKALCFSPYEEWSAGGEETRKKSPYFLINVATRKELDKAHKGLIKTKYFNNMKVATKYPNIAKKYFEDIGFQCSILELYGSIELAPVLGLSDFVVDIVETGKTLKENGLKEHDTIANVSSLLIANKVSYKLKRKEIDSITNRIKL